LSRIAGHSGREVRRVAEGIGWELDHWRGDHMVFKKAGSGRNLSIPDHRAVSPGTLRQIIRTMGLTVDEFLRLAGR